MISRLILPARSPKSVFDCILMTISSQVVGLMREMSAQMETERQRIAMAERKKEELRMMAENAERDRVRAEKKAAKAANKKGNKGTNSSNAANTNNGKHATLDIRILMKVKMFKTKEAIISKETETTCMIDMFV